MIDWCQITIKEVPLEAVIEDVLRIPLELMTVTGYEKGIAGHEVVAIFDNIKVLKPTGNAQYQGFQILMSGKGCRNYENFLQLNEETWFDFLNRVCQYHINVPRIDLAIDDRKPYLSIPDLIVRTKEGLLSTKLREIDFHDSGELKEEVFQSKGGSLYLGSSASNLRLVFYEKGYEQNKKYGTELDENWNRYELRFRQEMAVSVVQELLKYRDVAGLAMEILNSKIRFLEKPTDSMTTRKRLYPTYQAWAELMKDIGKVKLSARGTFTFTRNKILEYDELPPKYDYQAITGKRVSDKDNLYYIAERLYTEDDFTVSTNANGLKTYKLRSEIPQPTLGGLLGPGDIKYTDVNGDGIIDSYDRVRGIGHPETPEIIYGFGLNAEYKGIYASIFFQGAGNTSVLLGGKTSEGWYPFSWGVDQSNYRTFALNRWTENNPSQDVIIPRLHKSNANNANNRVASTWWLRDGSFLRLKNIEIGYQIPKKFLSKIGFEAARIYLMGYNLAVWDHIKYFDPEAGNANAGLNYPLPRTYTIGLDFTF